MRHLPLLRKIWTSSPFRNFLSLSVLQAVAVATPLITMPWVVQVVGMEKFGILAMALALISYFELITDYGFDLSATRQISMHREDSAGLQVIFSAVTLVKGILCLGGLIVLIVLTTTVPVFREFGWIYLLTYGRVIGKWLFPVWFYQGLEQMRFITLFNAASRILFTGLIFLLVRTPEDYYIVPALQSLGALIPGLFAQLHVRRKFGIELGWPGTSRLTEALTNGFHIFLSRVYVNLYNSFNILLLGFMSGYAAVGQYSLAAKVIEAAWMVFIPANNALFPYLARLWKESTARFNQLVGKLRTGFTVAGTLLGLAVVLLTDTIIRLIQGKPDETAAFLVTILSLKLPIIALGPLYTSVFITQGRNRDYMWVVRNTFLANLILVPVGIYFSGPEGLAGAVVAVSVLHQILFLHKRRESTSGALVLNRADAA